MPLGLRIRIFGAALISFTVLSAPALDWTSQPGSRLVPLDVPATGKPGFTEIPAAGAGINFINLLAEERSVTNQIFLNGSGVALGDIDGDGRCDIYFCGLDNANRLYRNLGNWHFEDMTRAAGVACAEQASTGAAFVDIDGDGDLDLFVNGIARGTRLFLNDGRGHFQEVTDSAGLRSGSGATSLALADIDGDGLLDLYVVNYRNDTMRDMPDLHYRFSVTKGVQQLLSVNGQPATSPEWLGRFSFGPDGAVLENGQPDALFRNDGKGHFIPISWTNGAFLDETGQPAQTPYDWGLSAMFRDLNGDGAPDLYVCNDFQSPDRIWINDGRGRFRALNRTAIRQTSLFSMGVDVADINGDGLDDIFVADMLSPDHFRRQVQVMDAMAFGQFRDTLGERPQFSRNTLFLNRGNGTYAEIAQLAGIDASDWSWCPAFMDVDLDGWPDLLITTGHWRDAQNVDIAREIEEAKKQKPLSPIDQLRLRKRFPRLETPNVAFRNRGDLTFESSGTVWGFDSRRISQGMALADLDGDGDLDVIINCLNGPPLLYRNDSSQPRLAVRLRGTPPNTTGVGAKIRVLAPGLPLQSQQIVCGGRYLSSDDFAKTFATGTATNRVRVEVAWRNGTTSVLTNVPANCLVEINESSAAPVKIEPKAPVEPFFENLTARLNHTHTDEIFDDFARQPLMPHKLSQLGPGITWFDFNADGWDDLIVGAGTGGRLAAFRNDGKGGFVRQRAKILDSAIARDLTTVLGWQPNPTNLVLLLGTANYESGLTNAPGVTELSLVTGRQDELMISSSSSGPLALADIDADGDLDLFVGGRVRAGRYPEPAYSYLLRNNHGRFEVDAELSAPFKNIGLVSGATFSDLDGDGWPELVLACEWGPLMVFKNNHGRFERQNPTVRWAGDPRTQPTNLNSLTGWWNGVAAGDFNNDGRLDLIAGNWGHNISRARYLPVHLFFANDESGGRSLLEAWSDPIVQKLGPVRDFGALSASFPMLQNRFHSFTEFSRASMADLIASGLPPLEQVNVVTFESLLLLNQGDWFLAKPLPIEVQMSPVFGIAVGDLDGDGNEDLFVTQNFFGVSPAESRHDAGCGVWLRGNGNGDFTAVPPQTSGLTIYGEGRGAALSDFDHDGRLDLAAGQNRGATELYRNVRARPGLRVRLEDSGQNLRAIGASVRLQYRSGRGGPAHEIHLGSGYWAQDSVDVVLGLAEEPAQLEIRWPGGRVEHVDLTADARIFTRRRLDPREH